MWPGKKMDKEEPPKGKVRVQNEGQTKPEREDKPKACGEGLPDDWSVRVHHHMDW